MYCVFVEYYNVDDILCYKIVNWFFKFFYYIDQLVDMYEFIFMDVVSKKFLFKVFKLVKDKKV